MKKIVLVEDDAAIRDAFAIALDPLEFSITSYETGTHLLQNDIEVPHLFVIDKNIAGVNGPDLCLYLKAHVKYKDVPVILISASPDLVKAAQHAGADGSMAKPFSLKSLREKIAHHIL